MNSENFHEYVKNPSMLHQVSYQELKSLVLQYPYSPNLRYLLLLKSLFDKNKDFDKLQMLASLSSPDRKKLRQLVKQYARLNEIQENYSLNEDFLELKDLSALENLLDEPAGTGTSVNKETGFAEAIVPPPPSTHSMLEDILDDEPAPENEVNFLGGFFGENSILENLLVDEPTSSSSEPSVAEKEGADLPTLETILEEAAEEFDDQPVAAPNQGTSIGDYAVEVVPEYPVEAPPTPPEIPLEITNEPDIQPVPKPRSAFHSWLKQFNPPQAGLLNTDLKDISLNSRHPHTIEEYKEQSAKQIADQSVEEDEEIVSETLALLLEKQKLFGKAISMYRRLSLQYPEKSSLFAAKIEELNKKM